LSIHNIQKVSVYVPSLTIQGKISTFLDRETNKIDQIIQKQERLIELLVEKRQAVISHAVTKGLDPTVPMKDSGVEWVGKIPAHWQVKPLKRITTSRCDGPFGSGLKSEHYSDEGVRVVRLQNIRANSFNDSDQAYISVNYSRELEGHDVKEGDVLIAGLGDDRNLVGRSCIAPRGIEPAIVKADCFRFRLNILEAVPAFVAMQLSQSAPSDSGTLSSGSTRSRIPLSVMGLRSISLPPLDEQKEIMYSLQIQLEHFGMLVTKSLRSIELLKERRSALPRSGYSPAYDRLP
jgi:type I restriction enzyme S subunit